MSTEIGFGIVGAGMVARYPASRALHDAIRAGELGDLVMGTATVPYYRPQSYYDSAAWRGTWSLDGGGALMNQVILRSVSEHLCVLPAQIL